MKKLVILHLVTSLLLVACKSKTTDTGAAPTSPIEYYHKVLALEETMSEPLLTTEAAITARSDKSDFEGVARAAKAMEDTVDLRIKALKQMDAVGKGGDDFKLTTTRYFEYIKGIYTAYRKIGEAGSEEQRIKAAEQMAQTINGQQAVLANLQMAQTKFAADNNFTINQ